MTTGHKTLTPTQIGNLLHALATRQVPWRAARVWFACVETMAIRETAGQVRRQRRDFRRVDSDFTRGELVESTGLNARSVGRALGCLQRRGLLSFTAKTITVGDSPTTEAVERIEALAGGRSARRPIPVPRTPLRFLARQPTAALGRVMLGYVCRGLSNARQGGAIGDAGTVKASWLADTLGLSLRSVRYAQARLRTLGWIGKDTGSKQWKLNRHGAWFRIHLDWKPSVTSGSDFAPPPTRNSTPVAPPKEDRKTPSESKNQKTPAGVFKTASKTGPLPPPSLRNILRADLHDPDRLRALLPQAVARGWVRDCEADALNFFAAAVRARSTPARDPVRVFVALVRDRCWSHARQAHEDEARRYSRKGESRQSPGTADSVSQILRAVLPASVLSRMAIRGTEHSCHGSG